MLDVDLYNSNSADASGDAFGTDTKSTVIGVCTVEVVGDPVAANCSVIIQGKIRLSSTASTDTGWVDIVTFSRIGADVVLGKAIGVFPYMRVVVANNSGNANIQVAVGYN